MPALAAENPTLDLRRALPDAPSWGSIAPADQPAARVEWQAFRREARTFRSTPARTLLAAAVAGNGINPVRAAANQMLLAATDFDLENVTVDQYLTGHPTALADVPVDQQLGVIGYLKGVQRIVRIIRKPEAIDALLGDGIHSGLRIARMPRVQFTDGYQAVLGGGAAADDAYNAAFRVATTAQLALTTVIQSVAGNSPYAVAGGSPTKLEPRDYAKALGLLQTKANADHSASWPKLFGEDSWCDCAECSSAWGPAAYFVDLVHMIDPKHPDQPPAEALFRRRPDLQYLRLTCDNANTPIPTIDLVNEILDIDVAGDLGVVVDAKSYDSTGISAEVLRSVPQNVITEVYVSTSGKPSLATEVYPFALPFHRPLAVLRTYLDQLGTSYRDVVDAFGPRDPSQGLSHAEQLAAEDLGLSRRRFELIAGKTADVTTPVAYGYAGGAVPAWRSQLASRPRAAPPHRRHVRRSTRRGCDVLRRPGRRGDPPGARRSATVSDRQHAFAAERPTTRGIGCIASSGCGARRRGRLPTSIVCCSPSAPRTGR